MDVKSKVNLLIVRCVRLILQRTV